jgi:hypothetical protein
MSTGEPYTLSCQCGSTKLSLPGDALNHLVNADGKKSLMRCNCSICVRQAPTFMLKDPFSIKVLSNVAGTTSEDDLGKYQRDEKAATFYFCQKCGIRMFGRGYVEQMGGDIASVNAGSMQGVDWSEYPVDRYWDGLNDAWEKGTRDKPYPFGFH